MFVVLIWAILMTITEVTLAAPEANPAADPYRGWGCYGGWGGYGGWGREGGGWGGYGGWGYGWGR